MKVGSWEGKKVGKLKSEVGPVVVPNEWDYDVARRRKTTAINSTLSHYHSKVFIRISNGCHFN